MTFPLSLSWAVEQAVDLSRYTIISSTAPIGQELRSNLKRGNLSLTEIYGSTETAALGYRFFPSQTYQALAFRKIEDNTLLKSDTARITIPDYLEWTDEKFFRLKGRKDGSSRWLVSRCI